MVYLYMEYNSVLVPPYQRNKINYVFKLKLMLFMLAKFARIWFRFSDELKTAENLFRKVKQCEQYKYCQFYKTAYLIRWVWYLTQSKPKERVHSLIYGHLLNKIHCVDKTAKAKYMYKGFDYCFVEYMKWLLQSVFLVKVNTWGKSLNIFILYLLTLAKFVSWLQFLSKIRHTETHLKFFFLYNIKCIYCKI